MESNYYLAAFDFGSDSTKMVLAAPDESKRFGLNIIHAEKQASQGISRGAVIDPNQAEKVVTNLLSGADKKIKALGKKSKDASTIYICTNINGCYNYRVAIRKTSSHIEGGMVTPKIERALLDKISKEVANALSDEEALQYCTPICYSIDNAPVVVAPVGEGCSIEGKYACLIAKRNAVSNINKAFDTKHTPKKLYSTAIAKSQYILQQEQKNDGVALVDLGAQTISVAVYHKGMLRGEMSIPFGMNCVTKDLKTALDLTSTEDAEHIKNNLAQFDPTQPRQMYQILLPSGKKFRLQGGFVHFVAKARLEELAVYIYQALGDHKNNIKSIVLSGRGAELANVCDVIRDVTGINTTKYHNQIDLDWVREDEDPNEYAAAIGMASLFVREYKTIDLAVEKDKNPAPQQATLFDNVQLDNGNETQVAPVIPLNTNEPDSGNERLTPKTGTYESNPAANLNQPKDSPEKNFFSKFVDTISSLSTKVSEKVTEAMTDEFDNKD